MISFIIPTVYKAPQLPQLLQNLGNNTLVTEVILYENAPNNGMLDSLSYSDKLRIKPYTKNLFCNSVWNYGTKNSKNYYYALCNDDILFPSIIIEDILYFYKHRPKSGFIGMHFCQFAHLKDKPLIYGVIEKDKWFGDGGWGSLIFNHKDNNVIIPNDLKQWHGDSYYINYSKYPCYDYYGDKFYTSTKNHSTSTPIELINTVCAQDCKVWKEKYKLDKPLWKK
jgi:hypothetical protein